MKYLLILLFVTSVFASEATDRIVPSYKFEGNEAEIVFRFDVTGSDSTILAVLFEPKHILKYAGRTNLVIKPVSQSANLNNLEYHYNYLVAQLLVEMKRERLPRERKITFQMTRYYKSSSIIPMVKSVNGSYKISSVNGKKIVEYRQKTVMEKEIGKVYQSLIKRDVRRFVRETIAYLDKNSEPTVASEY